MASCRSPVRRTVPGHPALRTIGTAGLVGGLVMFLGSLDEVVADLSLGPDALALVAEFNKQVNAYGAVLLIIGIIQMIGGVGVLAHRNWGRAFGILLGRFFYLQIVQHDYYTTRAEDNRISLVPIPHNRGVILDHKRRVLAPN